MSKEVPTWQQQVQEKILHWGNTHPLTLKEATELVVYDREGRPCVESTHIFNPADVPHAFSPFKGNDNRAGVPVNMSAYESVRRDLPEALEMIRFFKGKLVKNSSQPMDFTTFLDVAYTTYALPTWLINKSDNPMKNGEIPTPIVGLVRLGRGLNKPLIIMKNMIQAKNLFGLNVQFDPDQIVQTPESFTQFVYDNNILIADDASVACPATRIQISSLVSAICEPGEGDEGIFEKYGFSLTSDDIERIRKLGRAHMISEEQTGLSVLLSIIIPMFMEEIPVAQLAKKLEAVTQDSLRELNYGQQIVSEALLREPSPPMNLRDLQMKIV